MAFKLSPLYSLRYCTCTCILLFVICFRAVIVCLCLWCLKLCMYTYSIPFLPFHSERAKSERMLSDVWVVSAIVALHSHCSATRWYRNFQENATKWAKCFVHIQCTLFSFCFSVFFFLLFCFSSSSSSSLLSFARSFVYFSSPLSLCVCVCFFFPSFFFCHPFFGIFLFFYLPATQLCLTKAENVALSAHF